MIPSTQALLDRLKAAVAGVRVTPWRVPPIAVLYDEICLALTANESVAELFKAAFDCVPALVAIDERDAAAVACSKAMSQAQEQTDAIKAKNARLWAFIASAGAAGFAQQGEFDRLKIENARLGVDWRQCHDRNAELCKEHVALKADNARLAGELATAQDRLAASAPMSPPLARPRPKKPGKRKAKK